VSASTVLFEGGQEKDITLELADLFSAVQARGGSWAGLDRRRCEVAEGVEAVLDGFPNTAARCLFLRIVGGRLVRFSLVGGYSLKTCPAGGWLFEPQTNGRQLYWLPQLPRRRRVDAVGHIVFEADAVPAEAGLTAGILEVAFKAQSNEFIDFVCWQFPQGETAWHRELVEHAVIERQPYFAFGSHTAYARLCDLYEHIIHGQVYGNCWTWPRKWKIHDELDAYALYLTCSGLRLSTGKCLYDLFKRQLVIAVVARQQEDGGWYHGEWTDCYESHFRLVSGGLHLLAAAVEEKLHRAAAPALARGADFVAGRFDRMPGGAWLLHDSLELDIKNMRKSPFKWVRSCALGKAATDMLVLNTHLDSAIAIARANRALGEARHEERLESARRSARQVLQNRPAEGLYRLIFQIVDLTLLPEAQALALPGPVRAIKRLGWKWLIPRLHMIKARWPRLVMPNGYIDRALTLKGLSHAYQSVNIWDLARFRRLFEDAYIDAITAKAAQYTHSCLVDYWSAQKRKHSLGFWSEALYFLYMQSGDHQLLPWLAQAVNDSHRAGLGLAPSLLGCNHEVNLPADQIPCPDPGHSDLRVVNLCGDGRREFLVVNVGAVSRNLADHGWYAKRSEASIALAPGEGASIEGKRAITR
jgi:hypothetical protein